MCDRARECAVLWFAEVQRRELYRALGYPSLHCYAREALGFTDNRTWQFKRLADDLDRLPALREAVADGTLGWTKAQQVARMATPASEAQWVARAADCGRRELEREVQAARGVARRQARSAAGAGKQLEMSAALAPAQVVGGQSWARQWRASILATIRPVCRARSPCAAMRCRWRVSKCCSKR